MYLHFPTFGKTNACYIAKQNYCDNQISRYLMPYAAPRRAWIRLRDIISASNSGFGIGDLVWHSAIRVKFWTCEQNWDFFGTILGAWSQLGLSCIGRTEYLEGILDGRSLLPQICLAGKYQITFGKSIKMSNYFWQVNKNVKLLLASQLN